MRILPTIKVLAERTVSKAGVWGIIPVPLERITDSLRLVAKGFKPEGELANVVVALNLDDRLIFVRSDDPPQVQRFAIAHAIGHAVLSEGKSVVDVRVNLDAPTAIDEIEANKFAAELLMPEDEFRDVWFTRRAKVKRVAAYFGLTGEVVKDRAASLGLPTFY